MNVKKRLTISRKFSSISFIVSIVTIIVAYVVLTMYKSTMIDEVYTKTKIKLEQSIDEKMEAKKDIGISNAFSIANDEQIKQSLMQNNRELAIESLDTINKTMKNGTKFKNIKIHIHTKDNKSYLRNWKIEKYGDDLSSFRKSVVTVNTEHKPINSLEIGKAGLSLRSVVPITNKGEHLGSLEFIQGLNSVAKSFNNQNQGFLLLMDINKQIAQPNPEMIFQKKYIISQKFFNKDFFEDSKKINLKNLFTNGYLLSEKYFYTFKYVEDFKGEKLGIYLVAEQLSTVNLAIDKTTHLVYIALLIVALAILASLVATLINLRSTVIQPIKDLQNSILNVKNDQSSDRIEILHNDEIGDVVIEFNSYLDALARDREQDQVVIDEAKSVIVRANRGLLNTSIKSQAASKRVQELAVSVNSLVKGTHKNLDSLSKVLVEYSNAKFDYAVPKLEGITGEIASIMSGAKNTGVTMSGVLAMIDNTTKRLLFASKDLNDASSELSNSSNAQAAALEQTAAAIEEILSTIKQSSQNATKMAELAQEVTNSSKVGETLANRTSDAMSDITQEVNAINDAITVIDQIAFQTNILSLNAAVEAATAGEAGKGFAVVAQEVRNLASRSADAANEIKTLVQNATTKAQSGQKISQEMIEGYNNLNQNITATITLIEDVAKAAQEQQNAMSQISDTVNELDKTTQKNASVASKINTMSHENEGLAQSLQTAVNRTSFFEESKRRVCDADMMFDLNALKSDHIKFKNTNFEKCNDGTRFSVTDHHSCNMGKWLDNMKDPDFLNSPLWEELNEVHKAVHMMVQDTVDLYAGGYANGQVFSVTNNVERNMNRVFEILDEIREYKCTQIMKRKRGEI